MANNILYIFDGTYGSLNQARLGKITPLVQGQYGQVLPLEIRTLDNEVANLTGYSTITALLQKGSTVIEVTGTLALSGTPSAGPNVNFTVAIEDTGAFGDWNFIVRLSDGSHMLKTNPVVLRIIRDPEATDSGTAMLVRVTEDERALLTALLAAGYPQTATTQQAGTSYTFALADAETVVQSTNGSAVTFTVPANATAAFPIGTVIGFEQYGAGALTMAAAGGVTVRNPHAGLTVSAQYGGGALRKIGTDEWMITGMLE